MKKYLLLLLLTALLFSLPACNPKEGSDNNDDGYPAPETAGIEDAYLAPVLSGAPAVVSGSLSIPAPAAGKAVIHGKMQTADGKAFTGTLFIGIFGLYIREGYPPPVEALVADSPAVVVDSEGQFYFADVQPGVYGFVALSPSGAQIVTANGTPVTVEALADQTVDVGTLVVP
jgi:hypothetical protein